MDSDFPHPRMDHGNITFSTSLALCKNHTNKVGIDVRVAECLVFALIPFPSPTAGSLKLDIRTPGGLVAL